MTTPRLTSEEALDLLEALEALPPLTNKLTKDLLTWDRRHYLHNEWGFCHADAERIVHALNRSPNNLPQLIKDEFTIK